MSHCGFASRCIVGRSYVIFGLWSCVNRLNVISTAGLGGLGRFFLHQERLLVMVFKGHGLVHMWRFESEGV